MNAQPQTEHRIRRRARPEKVEEVAGLRRWLQGAAAAILTDYRGLNVGELAQLRARLREVGAEYRIVKNTLLRRAVESLGLRGLDPYLEGPTAVAVSRGDPLGPARALQEFIRAMRKLEIKGALVEGQVFTAAQVRALAEMPAKPQLQAMALAALQAPLTGLLGVLTGLPRNLVSALDQIRRQKDVAA